MNLRLYENIESYSSGRLNGPELVYFKNILKNNDIVMVRLSLYRTIESEMKNQMQNDQQEQDLRKSLSQLGEKYFKAESTPLLTDISHTGRNWLLAAVVIVMFLFFLYLYLRV